MTPRPMLATPAQTLPIGPLWTYEVKWDGYRAIAIKDGRSVQLISRHGKDLTRDYPSVVAAVATVRADRATLDGEIVALDSEGRPSFQALQHRVTSDRAIVLYAFDLLELNGVSWERQPLDARRRELAQQVGHSKVLLSAPLDGDVEDVERVVREMQLEGVVAKRRDSTYRQGQRSEDWIKVRFSPRQEFVVGGFDPTGSLGLDSLVVGYYQGRALHFAAKVRAGLTPHQRRQLLPQLERLEVSKCPFPNLPNAKRKSRWNTGITAEDMRDLRWVRLKLVVEVSFVEWTQESVLRHPKYEGLRSDKPAREVRSET